MEQAITTETIFTELKDKFSHAVLSGEILYDMFTITVSKSKIFEVIKFLKETPSLNFHFLTTACGLHFPAEKEKFGMMYQLHNMITNTRIRLKTFTDSDEPEFISLTSLWPTANWMERETYDFFGFKFTGHPDLRRILNVDDMVGWPMRKEYPLEDQARWDKDDKMFGR